MAVSQRRLGGSGLTLSEICFGMGSLERGRRGEAEEVRQAAELIAEARAAGIDTFHYGLEYYSGYIFREAVPESERGDVKVIAKIPVAPETSRGELHARLVDCVDRTLADLGIESLAVLQLIYCRTLPEPEKLRRFDAETQKTLADAVAALVDAGKIRCAASFAYSSAFGKALARCDWLQGIAGFFNLMEMDLFANLPALGETGKGLLAMRPFCGGMLTTKRASWRALPDGDRLKRESMRAAFRHREALGELCAAYGRSIEDLALSFHLSLSEVATSIVGVSSRAQLADVLRVAADPANCAELATAAYDLFLEQTPEARKSAFGTTKGWELQAG